MAAALRRLPVQIEDVHVEVGARTVPSYPGEPRPTSIVRVSGEDHSGYGEHVGWTTGVHTAFAARASGAVRIGDGTIEERSAHLRSHLSDPYDRAALEAALIDLGLRQADLSLADVAQAPSTAARYVVSFGASRAPAEEVRSTLAGSGLEAKVDVDPDEVSREALTDLIETGAVAVYDWKRSGQRADHEWLLERAPDALQEDPGPEPCLGSPSIAHRRSIDGPFGHAHALEGAPLPAAANLKPARMGGVLEALDGAAFCQERGISLYFGGMFELGPGRRQLLALACLLSPQGPNDIAPIPEISPPPPWPERLAPPSGAGFGDFRPRI